MGFLHSTSVIQANRARVNSLDRHPVSSHRRDNPSIEELATYVPKRIYSYHEYKCLIYIDKMEGEIGVAQSRLSAQSVIFNKTAIYDEAG